MSIQSEIERIENNVANTYSTLEELGADMPAQQNTNNLQSTVSTIKAVRYDSQTLTETQKTQARTNIGAASTSEVNQLSQEVSNLAEEAESKVSAHNTSDVSHSDIRLLIEGLTTRLNTLANSDDTTLDQMAEVVAYIKNNKSLIDAITTGKVSVSDIVDNLTTNVSNKPLSAKQGVQLKALIDDIVVPTLLSELGEDSTHRLVTDVEKETWNAKSNFSGKYADLTGKPTIPSKTSQLTNDSGFAKQADVTELLGQKADKTAIPTKTSQLTNDSGFLTQHQDISGKVDKNAITLDKHTDGLVYIFISGNPVGNGVELGEIVEGDVIGVLDDNNNIVLTGALADGTYTLKYEKEDGTFTDIGNLIVGETVVEIINQIPISTDASGNLFVGTNGEKGYKTGFRLSTSTGNETSTAGVEVTGFIPVKKNDTIYIKGITFGASNGSHAIVYYDSSKARVGGGYIGTLFGKGVNGEIASVKITTDCAFIRISADVINADSILTVNQPITE